MSARWFLWGAGADTRVGSVEQATGEKEERSGASGRYTAGLEWNRLCPQSTALPFAMPEQDDCPWR